MVRGRWAKNDDEWYSRESGGRKTTDYKKEAEKLRKELDEERKRNERNDRKSQVQALRPNAKEGPIRDGDWLCCICGFATNRSQRGACYRCAAARGLSFPHGSVHAQPSVAAVAGPAASSPHFALGAAATTTTSTSPSFPPSSAPSPSSPTPGSVAVGWFPQLGGARPLPASMAVPGFIGASATASQAMPPPAAGPQPAAACAKSIKGRLEALLQARAAVASNPLCSDAVASIDAQVAKTRAELAQAQPLEVALRGTLGAVASARQALQRAEGKLTKCEQQVVAAVSAYDLAAAEAQTCRRQLADAEAATARTAGSHADLRQVVGADPGAAWAAFRMAAEARCVPGAVAPELVARASAAFAEMQAICALLPAQPPSAEGGGAAAAPAAAAGSDISSSTTTCPQTQDANAKHGNPGVPTSDAGAIAAAAITAVLEQQRLQQTTSDDGRGGGDVSRGAGSSVLHPSSSDVASHFELVAAAAAAQQATAPTTTATETAETVPPLSDADRAALQRSMEKAEQEARVQAEAAAFAAQQLREQVARAAATATPNGDSRIEEKDMSVGKEDTVAVDSPSAAGNQSADANGLPGPGTAKPADDCMGGGASDSIVGKRGIDAISAGRSIAAKAKARASA